VAGRESASLTWKMEVARRPAIPSRKHREYAAYTIRSGHPPWHRRPPPERPRGAAQAEDLTPKLQRGMSGGQSLLSLAESMLAGGNHPVYLGPLRADEAGQVLQAVAEVPAPETVSQLLPRFMVRQCQAGAELARAGIAVPRYQTMWEARRHTSPLSWRPAQEMAGAEEAEPPFVSEGGRQRTIPKQQLQPAPKGAVSHTYSYSFIVTDLSPVTRWSWSSAPGSSDRLQPDRDAVGGSGSLTTLRRCGAGCWRFLPGCCATPGSYGCGWPRGCSTSWSSGRFTTASSTWPRPDSSLIPSGERPPRIPRIQPVLGAPCRLGSRPQPSCRCPRSGPEVHSLLIPAP
jgi:hypothetical protein